MSTKTEIIKRTKVFNLPLDSRAVKKFLKDIGDIKLEHESLRRRFF